MRTTRSVTKSNVEDKRALAECLVSGKQSISWQHVKFPSGKIINPYALPCIEPHLYSSDVAEYLTLRGLARLWGVEDEDLGGIEWVSFEPPPFGPGWDVLHSKETVNREAGKELIPEHIRTKRDVQQSPFCGLTEIPYAVWRVVVLARDAMMILSTVYVRNAKWNCTVLVRHLIAGGVPSACIERLMTWNNMTDETVWKGLETAGVFGHSELMPWLHEKGAYVFDPSLLKDTYKAGQFTAFASLVDVLSRQWQAGCDLEQFTDVLRDIFGWEGWFPIFKAVFDKYGFPHVRIHHWNSILFDDPGVLDIIISRNEQIPLTMVKNWVTDILDMDLMDNAVTDYSEEFVDIMRRLLAYRPLLDEEVATLSPAHLRVVQFLQS
jgi:hypothetical protein